LYSSGVAIEELRSPVCGLGGAAVADRDEDEDDDDDEEEEEDTELVEA
jgi:hypothetical protein